jgi:hypothetical protein
VIQRWIKFGIACAAASLLGPAGGRAQTGARPSAQGTLTVTAMVVSSVGVEISPDGEQRIVVANAVDPRDNVSGLRRVKEKPQDKLVLASHSRIPLAPEYLPLRHGGSRFMLKSLLP